METESRVEKIMSWIVLLIYVLIAAGVFFAGYLTGKSRVKPVQQGVSISVDTAKHIAPVPVDSVSKGYVRIPVVVKIPTADEPKPPNSSIVIYDPKTLDSTFNISKQDSLSAYLPIEQKEYRDSNYTAWVSGYDPKLDSINIYRKTTTITKTITRTVTKRHVFNVGIVGGAGYGLLTKKPDVWVGVGVSINLFRR